MIIKFKIFETVIFSDDKLSVKNQKVYNKSKFKFGEPVRIKSLVQDGVNLIFYIDWINTKYLDTVWYHIQDDVYIYSGIYREFELEKISDEEKIALKFNL